jgi:protein arginine kinase activator
MSTTPEDRSPALCQSCGIRPAAVEFIQVTGNERREIALCRECAATHGVGMQLDAFQRLAQLLMHQMRPVSQVSEEWQTAMTTTCSKCGLVFEQFVQTGLLGCPQCYTDFHDILMPVLRRLHGVVKQSPTEPGTPRPASEPQPMEETETSLRERLETELQRALDEENFERAALIRDQLRNL